MTPGNLVPSYYQAYRIRKGDVGPQRYIGVREDYIRARRRSGESEVMNDQLPVLQLVSELSFLFAGYPSPLPRLRRLLGQLLRSPCIFETSATQLRLGGIPCKSGVSGVERVVNYTLDCF